LVPLVVTGVLATAGGPGGGGGFAVFVFPPDVVLGLYGIPPAPDEGMLEGLEDATGGHSRGWLCC